LTESNRRTTQEGTAGEASLTKRQDVQVRKKGTRGSKSRRELEEGFCDYLMV
jgi:hypothetical protein